MDNWWVAGTYYAILIGLNVSTVAVTVHTIRRQRTMNKRIDAEFDEWLSRNVEVMEQTARAYDAEQAYRNAVSNMARGLPVTVIPEWRADGRA